MSDGNSWCTCRRKYGQSGGYDTSGCPVHDRPISREEAKETTKRVLREHGLPIPPELED